jgi:hypothetical protein
VTNNVSKFHISGRNWLHPERDDDARRHHGPGANRTISDHRYVYHGGGMIIRATPTARAPPRLHATYQLSLRRQRWTNEVGDGDSGGPHSSIQVASIGFHHCRANSNQISVCQARWASLSCPIRFVSNDREPRTGDIAHHHIRECARHLR